MVVQYTKLCWHAAAVTASTPVAESDPCAAAPKLHTTNLLENLGVRCMCYVLSLHALVMRGCWIISSSSGED